MTRAAFATWDERIAPVFDVARSLHLVDADKGRIVLERQESLPEELPAQIALRLAELGVGTLVCGAISRPLQAMVAAYGIRVIAFITGDLREVVQAWLAGGLAASSFAMPGCCGRGRGRGRSRRGAQVHEEVLMNGRGQGGSGSGRGGGQGRGQGRGGQGRGRMGGSAAAGPAGFCVCRQCGLREPHERGVPCTERRCPQCGAPMTRESA